MTRRPTLSRRPDYAHSAAANNHRRIKAKTIARWCYRHGVTAAHLRTMDAGARRRLATRIGVPAPHESPGALGKTWQLVCELLGQRIEWDAAHQVEPPAAPIDCLRCLLRTCTTHRRGRRCVSCGQPLHPVTVAEGYATHPACHVDRFASPAHRLV